MKRAYIATALAVTMLLSACSATPVVVASSQSGLPQSSASESSSSAPVQPAITIDIALANDILARQRVPHDEVGGMGEFYKAHPDFLYDQSGRRQVTSGKPVDEPREYVQLMGGLPQNDLFNRERLVLFIESYRNGIADSIVILSWGDPVALWLTVFTYDGNGTAYTVQSCFPLQDELKWHDKYSSNGLVETDAEWIMLDDPMQRISYTKYGYEPVPLGEVTGERTVAEVWVLAEPLCKTLYPLTDSIVVKDPQTIDDVPCYVFGLYEPNHTNYSELLAVATDLSRYYQMEHVNGNWVLHARPRSAPPAANAELPSYDKLVSSVYLDFPAGGRIDRTLDPGLAEAAQNDKIPIDAMIIDENKLVPSYIIQLDAIKSNIEQLLTQNKLTPLLVDMNEYLVVTTDAAGNENGCIGFMYDAQQKVFTVNCIGPADSIDDYLRHDLVLSNKRKEQLRQSGIDLTKAKAYHVLLEEMAYGHLITDGTNEVFICTNQSKPETDVLYDEIYSSKEIISFYQKLTA